MSVVDALTTAVLPVLAIAVAGYALGALRDVEVGPLATVTIYVLTPALVFHSLTTTDLGGREVAAVAGGVVLFTGVMVVLAAGAGRALGEAGPNRSGFVLASAFPNSGNFGIPLSAFAFGVLGRSTAVLFLTTQAVLTYTLGLYIAARGRGTLSQSLAEVLRIPLVYAVAAAGAARWLGSSRRPRPRRCRPSGSSGTRRSRSSCSSSASSWRTSRRAPPSAG